MNGTVTIAQAGPYPYTFPHDGNAHRIRPLFHRPAGSGRSAPSAPGAGRRRGPHLHRPRPHRHHPRPARPRQALTAVRQGDTLVVPKLDRLARSVPDARAIADRLQERGVKLALGRALYDPGDSMGKMFFNILATFAEFEADLIRMRTPEGMAIARAKGKLRGKQPKLSDRQQRELYRMHATGEYSISDLAELFSVSRPTVYRTLNRRHSLSVRSCPLPESTRSGHRERWFRKGGQMWSRIFCRVGRLGGHPTWRQELAGPEAKSSGHGAAADQ